LPAGFARPVVPKYNLPVIGHLALDMKRQQRRVLMPEMPLNGRANVRDYL
jgi:hypothetical protein